MSHVMHPLLTLRILEAVYTAVKKGPKEAIEEFKKNWKFDHQTVCR